MKRFSIYLLFVICLFITGCGNDKTLEVATLDEFETITSNMGFTVNDNMRIYSNVSYILNSKVAKYEEIEIEMIEYSDASYAETVQNNHIESFNLLKSTGAYAEKEKGGNYYKYALVSNGRYMVSTRVDNTLIFCKVLLEDRETVEAIMDELGY